VASLRDYTVGLRQRNQLLIQDRRGSGVEAAEWSAWEEILARSGASIDRRRRTVCEALDRHVRALAERVDPELRPALEYRDGFRDPGAPELPEAEEIAARLARLEASRAADRRIGWTMHGPHRGRLRCTIAGEELTDGASRGYSRLYSILLRLALAQVFEERQSDPPVVLLDDPESELDPRWIGRVLDLVPESSQVLVTACRELTWTPPRLQRIAIAEAALAGNAA
jgi:DNA replication and repair protein RecF